MTYDNILNELENLTQEELFVLKEIIDGLLDEYRTEVE